MSKLDKNEAIFLYGAIGSRSIKAKEPMKELDFQEVYNLKNGIRGWKVGGYEIAK